MGEITIRQAQWTCTGFDGSAHVAEETLDPRRQAPWGMVMSVVVSGVFGYLLILSLTSAIPGIALVLGARDTGGNPTPAVLAIVDMALGNHATVAVLGLTVLAMWFCGLAAFTSVSRTFLHWLATMECRFRGFGDASALSGRRQPQPSGCLPLSRF